jgi:ATP-dependent DNA helicase RecQ
MRNYAYGMTDLTSLLHSTFGFPAFRANQEAVCRAATEGRDVLLVMPTGAGKSLCYQLPAIARQSAGAAGAALVISPLIALMDDQAAKLTAAGLKVARIHSGLSRDHARQACRDYLDGNLNFLFIAPERMRVPGFPEMLAKRKPSLIAIDEAHCISAWGHDFRPDYRTLGDHLPALRPAPILALTATATPTVQRDIVAQLQLHSPALFIHGFRRSNLAIEVVEMSKPRRHEFTANLLKDPASRPAIVYAPSRKASEELATELNLTLGTKTAAAYHAGLEPSVREQVQAAFQAGKLQIVVATIAFGMGIDKADVRTVVHTALPSSVEAFYQEIGRAGRDGLPSRTVLLHGFADRRMHEFFLDRDYPPATDLARVAQVLTPEFVEPEPLAQHIKMDFATFSKAIEKLIAQGAASIDLAGNVRATPSARTPASWRPGYHAQIAFRRSQIDRMVAFAEQPQCRMAALVNHFGDTADGLRPCGKCDICSPTTTTAQSFRAPDSADLRQLLAILRALVAQPRATGKLHSEISAAELASGRSVLARRAFDALLDTLTRACLITLTTEQWTNPAGDLIAFKKAALTHEGREAAGAGSLNGFDIILKDAEPAPAKSRKSTKSRKRSPSRSDPAKMPSSRPQAERSVAEVERPSHFALRSADTNQAPSEIHHRTRPAPSDPTATLTLDQQALDHRLRAWRKSEAEKIGLPQFFVLGSSTLRSIVLQRPRTVAQLQTIAGIGPDKAEKFGPAICAVCNA